MTSRTEDVVGRSSSAVIAAAACAAGERVSPALDAEVLLELQHTFDGASG